MMNNTSLPYFDKDTSNILKGIALIMMFIHHFYTFPTWWLEGISYPLIERLSPYFCAPFQLCVPIFCFLTGYFYFYNKNKSYKYSLKKITDILISYWCVFFVFAIIAVLCLDYQYTLLMWFVSCIFFNNCKAIFQPILYYPHNPVIVTIWGLVLCFVLSYILDIGIKRIQNIKNRFFF